MIIDNPVRLIHELKGAPLSIIMLLQCAGQRVKQEWLERCSGYTDKPVSRALDYLEEIGMVDHTSSGWRLTVNGATQLPLMIGLLPEEAGEIGESNDDGPEEENEESAFQPPAAEESRKISDSVVRTYLLNLNDHDSVKVSKYDTKKRKNSGSPVAIQALLPAAGERPEGESAGDQVEAVKARLLREGVNLSQRVMDIVRRPYVTEDYVQFHIERLEGEGKTFPADAGLLIHVLDHADAGRPEEGAQSHRKNCQCEVCQGKRQQRYSDWEK